MRRTIGAAAALAALTLATGAGCTVGDGQGFGRLTATLSTRLAGLDASTGRVTADGWYRTNNSFELQLSTLTLQVRDLQLRGTAGAAAGPAAGAASAGCSFDPSSPPAGCTLCHGGHCHCGDELKSYAELEAQVCGGGAASAPASDLARMPVEHGFDLLSPVRRDLTRCSPSCELAEGQAQQVQVQIDRLTLKGKVRDLSLQDRLAGAVLAVALALDLKGAALSAQLSPAEPIDDDSPYRLDLDATLPVTLKLLDDVAWDKLTASNGSIAVDAKHNRSAAQRVASNLALSTLSVQVARSD